MAKKSTVLNMSKELARLQHAIRDYRLTMTLKVLNNMKTKSYHMKELEAKLSKELSKRLQDQFAIDSILDELDEMI